MHSEEVLEREGIQYNTIQYNFINPFGNYTDDDDDGDDGDDNGHSSSACSAKQRRW